MGGSSCSSGGMVGEDGGSNCFAGSGGCLWVWVIVVIVGGEGDY